MICYTRIIPSNPDLSSHSCIIIQAAANFIKYTHSRSPALPSLGRIVQKSAPERHILQPAPRKKHIQIIHYMSIIALSFIEYPTIFMHVSMIFGTLGQNRKDFLSLLTDFPSKQFIPLTLRSHYLYIYGNNVYHSCTAPRKHQNIRRKT